MGWGGVGWDGDPITSFDTNKDVPSTVDEAQGNVLPDDHAVSLKRDRLLQPNHSCTVAAIRVDTFV